MKKILPPLTFRVVSRAVATLTMLIALMWPTAHCATFSRPEPVLIEGYDDHAMEPFITRDGRMLLFNNSNDPRANTELHWAEHVSPLHFRYRGKITGANSDALDGVPSMDRDGMLYFVSTRSYRQTLSTIYRARFAAGHASAVQIVEGLSRKQPGALNFDAEISADGQYLYAVDGVFSGGPAPQSADLFVARRVGDRFERLPNSAEIMAHINTPALEYAPAISEDELELFFTRMSGALFWHKLTILHATRKRRDLPFEPPVVIDAISGSVEAPTLGSDGRSLYYHKKVDGLHRIFRVTRP